MKLSTLLQHLPGLRSQGLPGGRASATREVRGVTTHLREVRPGMAYFALPDESRANPFLAHAASQRGASLVVCGTDPDLVLPDRVPAIRVANPHAALATAAAALHAFPARRLQLLAVTGDASGRRGVAHLLARILAELGIPTGSLGEAGSEVGGRRGEARLSQRVASEVHDLLDQQVRAGGGCMVLEFAGEPTPEALAGLEFAREIVVRADLPHRHLRPLLQSPRGSRLELLSLDVPRTTTTRLVGRRSLQALDQVWDVAVAVAQRFGHTAAAVANTLPVIPPVRGCLEPVHCGQPFGVLVDAATTATSLTRALQDAREMTRGRLHLVCGATADTPEPEAAAMGQAALALADHVHVTSDNPGQRPFAELAERLLGGSRPRHVTLEPDRAAAIRCAVRAARAGDVVVLAGKADAPVQRLAHVIVPFDDRAVAVQALNARGYVGGGE